MAFTDDQNAAIKSAYTQAKLNNDPQGLMKQMTDFGVDVNGISGATGYSNQEIGNWLSASGAPKGFGGYTAPDNMYDGWNQHFGTSYDKNGVQQPTAAAPVNPNDKTVIGGGIVSPSGQYQTTGPSAQPTGILSQPTSTPATNSATSTSSTQSSTPTPQSLGLPATWTISPDQTVEGRINNLTDPNNPLIAQARSRALGTMNGRGLLNSSIAMGAADSAAYDAATPIATADAANASKVAGYNTDQKNQFAIKNLDDATNRYNIDTSAKTSRDNAQLSADTQVKIKQLDAEQQSKLEEIKSKDNAIIQNSNIASSAYDKYANTLYNNSVNKDMTPEARYQADQNAFNIYQQQLSLASKLMGVPDVSGLLDFTQVDPAAPAQAKDTTVIGGGNVTPPASPVVAGGGILTGNGFEMR